DGLINEDSPRNQQTNVAGMFASGEVDYQYHGANRLGANSLLSCLYAGWIGGKAMVRYAASGGRREVAEAERRGGEKRWEDRFRQLSGMTGDENPYRLHQELGEMMNEHVTIVRANAQLRKVYDRLEEMLQRTRRLGSLDGASWANPSLLFAN